jgi:hypothetical protein
MLMRRRTLDLFFVVGGFVLAALLATLGFVLQSNADFANDYVHNQLSQQKIVFTPTAGLSPEEKKATCLVEYQGQPLATGPQAECYANRYIAFHLSEVNDGKTYAETSGESRAAATAADEAEASDAAEAATLLEAADVLDGKTQTLFRGETLRGLLLTSYGFSEFGRKAEQAATVAFIVAFVLFLASIAGVIHLARTPKEEVVE